MVSKGGLVDAIGVLVDERVGIVQWVEQLPTPAGDPLFFHYAAKAADTQAFTRQQNFSNTGGASLSRERALAKALGEAVERYCSAIFDVEDLPLCTAEACEFDVIDPGEWIMYGHEQYADRNVPWVPFTASTPVRWALASDLTTGAVVGVPACRVFVPYTFYSNTLDSPIDQPISTGLACHDSYESAAVHGLCEVIERDAFSLTWQAMLAPPRIHRDSMDDAVRERLHRFERCGATVTLFDITTDVGIPVVLAVARHPDKDWPPLAFAASSSPSGSGACCGALEELAHTLRYMRLIHESLPRMEPTADFSNVVDQTTHLNFWVDRAHSHLADFLWSGTDIVPMPHGLDAGSDDELLRDVVQQLTLAGQRPLIADITTADVRSLGLWVVRALVPGLHPLHMGHALRALSNERLAACLRSPRSHGANPAPHPYP